MKKTLKKLISFACIITILASSMPVFAAGYQLVLDTNITYETNFYTTGELEEYTEVTEISNLISNFSNGYAIVYENVEIYDAYFMHLVYSESQYIIDASGNRVAHAEFDSFSACRMISSGVYDPTFGYGLDSFGGTTVSMNMGGESGEEETLYGYVGIADNVVIPCIYEDVVLRCNENVFRIGTFGDYTYIDKNGNEVAEPEVSVIDEVYEDSFESSAYSYVEGRDGFYLAEIDGKYGIINRNEEIVVPIEYDYICGLQSGYCWVAKNGKWSLYKLSKDSISVTVNNTPITFDQNPLIINGRTLAPVRAIFEALGATVEWKNDTREVISTKGDVTITMAIDSTTMYKNGNPITLDVAPQIIGGRTLVPVRAIAEAFNCKVEWNNDTQTVIITEQ